MALSFLLREVKNFPGKQRILQSFEKNPKFQPNEILHTMEKERPEEFAKVNQKLLSIFTKISNGNEVDQILNTLENSQSEEDLMFLCYLYLGGNIKKNRIKLESVLNRILKLNPKYASKYASDIYFQLGDFKSLQKFLPYSENKNFYYGYLYYTENGVFNKDIERALDFLEKDKNHPKSLFLLGKIYLELEEYNKSFECFKKSYELGEINSTTYLKKMYLNGKGCEKDVEKAYKILEENEPDPDCSFSLGEYYFEKDNLKSFNYLNNAFKNGVFKAASYLGVFYFKPLPPITEKNYETAKKYFKREPNEMSNYYLGLCYYNGYGVRKNYNKAFEYFKKGSRENSMSYLSKMYLEGLGCKMDIIKGIQYLQKSAQTNEKSKVLLASFYLFGRYVQTDVTKGISILKEVNDDESNFYLGKYYFLIGHYEKSLEYLNKLKDLPEEAQAMILIMNENILDLKSEDLFQLGLQYLSESLIEKDQKKAYEYFEKAYEKGHPNAAKYLGELLVYGYGCERDIPKGIEILEKSNDPDSFFNLGIFYYNGVIDYDYEKSFQYFTKAFEKGHLKSTFFLGSFYFRALPPIFKRDLAMAEKYYKIDKNNPLSLKELGKIHYYNTKNYEKSLYYFRESLKLKRNLSIYKYIGQMYLDGLGVKKDKILGKKLLEIYKRSSKFIKISAKRLKVKNFGRRKFFLKKDFIKIKKAE